MTKTSQEHDYMKVGEIARSVSDTHTFSKPELIFLNTSDISKGKFLHSTYSLVSQMPGQAKKSISEGDILFSEIRPSNGRWALVREEADDYVVSTKLMVIRCDTSKVDANYFYQFLTSNKTTSILQNLAESRSGTFPQITFDDVSSLDIYLPPLADQKRIAGALGALDDLIETNRVLIKNLLELADAKSGMFPGDFEHLTFNDVCKVFGGGTPSTKDGTFWGGKIAWATPTDMTALPSPYLFDTSRKISEAGLEACSSKLFPEGSILMTSRATIGEIAVSRTPTSTNQGFIIIEPREEYDLWFLFHEVRRRVPEFKQKANGSTFLELSRGTFKSLSVKWPSREFRQKLHSTLDPIHEMASSLELEVIHVKRTREELLPLLMAGKISVKGIAA
jgi:type I restriction enzyme S subunit